MKFSVCGHSGKGAYCHRCKDAEALEQRAASLEATDAKAWCAKHPWLSETEDGLVARALSGRITVRRDERAALPGLLRAEAERLRAPAATKRRVVVSQSLADQVADEAS